MIIVYTILNILRAFYYTVKLAYHKAKWRSYNAHNQTVASNIFSFDNISVGRSTYGIITVYRWGSAGEGLHIGNFCSIASGVKFILGGNHHTDTISTYPFEYYYDGGKNVAVSKGPIIVEDDVWIGSDVSILSGITIGKGSVIAASSVVTKDVEPYSIIGGNPSRVLKFRFTTEEMNIIRKVDFAKLDDKTIRDNLGILSERVGNRGLPYINNLCSKLK